MTRRRMKMIMRRKKGSRKERRKERRKNRTNERKKRERKKDRPKGIKKERRKEQNERTNDRKKERKKKKNNNNTEFLTTGRESRGDRATDVIAPQRWRRGDGGKGVKSRRQAGQNPYTLPPSPTPRAARAAAGLQRQSRGQEVWPQQ